MILNLVLKTWQTVSTPDDGCGDGLLIESRFKSHALARPRGRFAVPPRYPPGAFAEDSRGRSARSFPDFELLLRYAVCARARAHAIIQLRNYYDAVPIIPLMRAALLSGLISTRAAGR